MSTYLYGIVSDSHPKELAGLRGIGKRPAPLRKVAAGDLAVVVSDVPADIRAKRRDLLAHETVLEALCDQGPTLPMRFGVIADDDESIAQEVSAEQERYQRLLSYLNGRVEINVKVKHNDEALLRAVLADHESLTRMNEDLRRQGGGHHDDRVRFGEMVAKAVDEREQRDAVKIISGLAAHAIRETAGTGISGYFVNHSFLVDREYLPEFSSAVQELRESAGEYVEVRTRGPLPPYSFTDTADVI